MGQTPAQKKAAQAAKAKADLEAAKNATNTPQEPTAAEKDTARLEKEKEEQAAKDKTAAEAAKILADAAKKEIKKGEFVNPFESGVTYEHFLNAKPENQSIEDFCKGHLDKSQIEWLVSDLSHYKK